MCMQLVHLAGIFAQIVDTEADALIHPLWIGETVTLGAHHNILPQVF